MKIFLTSHAAYALALAALVHAAPRGWSQEDAPTAPVAVAEPTGDAAEVAVPEEPPVPAGKIRLNFRNAPADTVLDHLSRAAGFVIVKDVPVAGTVDVWSHQPLSPEEAVDLLNTVLARQNLAAVQTDRVLRIVSRDAALSADLPVAAGADPETMFRSEAMATQIIPVKHADAAKMVENLKPLLGAKSQLSANASSNSLILTDTKTNIRRMALIVQALDTSISSITDIRVFPLKHAKAATLAEVVNKVFEPPTQTQTTRGGALEFFARMRGRGGPGGGGQAGPGGQAEADTSEAKTATAKVTAVADERSNSLVVSAAGDLMAQIAVLVEQVDVPTTDDAIVEVFPLTYADADDVVAVLKEIYSASSTTGTASTQQRQFGMFGMRGGMPQPQQATTANRSLSEVEMAAVADTRTNSVVVSASPNTLTTISKVIEKLDATPKNVTQVYIYRIENANLENLKAILEGMFDDIADTGTTTTLAPGGGAARTGTTGPTRRN